MEENKGLKIEVTPEMAGGKYANLAIITHGPNEFFIDMICVSPGTPQARVQSRIVMTPENTKQLLMALEENVRKYEEIFGKIQLRTPAGPTKMGPVGKA